MLSGALNALDALADLTREACEISTLFIPVAKSGKLRPREEEEGEEEPELISSEAGWRFPVQAQWPQVCQSRPLGSTFEL